MQFTPITLAFGSLALLHLANCLYEYKKVSMIGGSKKNARLYLLATLLAFLATAISTIPSTREPQ